MTANPRINADSPVMRIVSGHKHELGYVQQGLLQ